MSSTHMRPTAANGVHRNGGGEVFWSTAKENSQPSATKKPLQKSESFTRKKESKSSLAEQKLQLLLMNKTPTPQDYKKNVAQSFQQNLLGLEKKQTSLMKNQPFFRQQQQPQLAQHLPA